MKDSCPATRATMCDGGTPMLIRDLGKLSYLRDIVGNDETIEADEFKRKSLQLRLGRWGRQQVIRVHSSRRLKDGIGL